MSYTTAGMAPGNDMLLKVKVNGVDQTVKIVNTLEPDIDYKDASGVRVIGVNMAAGNAAVASKLQGAFASTANGPALNVNVAVNGGALEFTATGSTAVTGLTSRTTASGVQGQGLALSLFVDQGGAPFTNNLDGTPPQKTGFASRIAINPAILGDNRLLVQDQVGGTLGKADRPNYLIAQLNSLQFVSGGDPKATNGRFQLSGNLGEVINQTIGFQGANINAVMTKSADRQLTLDTVVQQMDVEYGVDVNEEMARLTELQNSYSANAHVVSVVKELLDTLFQAV